MKNDAIHTLMSNKFMKDDFNGYQMLILDGYYATQKINDPIKPHIPIIAMTANAFAEYKKKL